MNWECFYRSVGGAALVMAVLGALISGWIWLLNNTSLYISGGIFLTVLFVSITAALYSFCEKEEEDNDAESD